MLLFHSILAAAAVSTTAAYCPDDRDHEVVFKWAVGTNSALTYVWPNQTFRERYEGITAVPIGVKVHGDSVFVTIPRWRRDSFPINVARIDRPAGRGCIESPSAPPLEAFPSLEMNKLGDCNAFQYVQGFEIDPKEEVMWLADIGREFGKPSQCAPKLLLLHIPSRRVLKTHIFPASVVSRTENFLNDVALDLTDRRRKFAYISNSDEGNIVVYDLARDKSWKAEHSSMKIDPKALQFNFLNPPVSFEVDSKVNGITFAPKLGLVLFSPLTSFSTFTVPSRSLRDRLTATNPQRLGKEIREITNDKPSPTDGLTVDKNGFMYMTEVTQNVMSRWDPSAPDFRTSRVVLAQDNTTMNWPDTVGIDDLGYLWATTRGMPLDRVNNFIIRIPIGAVSYLYD